MSNFKFVVDSLQLGPKIELHLRLSCRSLSYKMSLYIFNFPHGRCREAFSHVVFLFELGGSMSLRYKGSSSTMLSLDMCLGLSYLN